MSRTLHFPVPTAVLEILAQRQAVEVGHSISVRKSLFGGVTLVGATQKDEEAIRKACRQVEYNPGGRVSAPAFVPAASD